MRQGILRMKALAMLMLMALAGGALAGCPDGGGGGPPPPMVINTQPGDAPNQNRPGDIPPPRKNPLEGVKDPLGRYDPGSGTVEY